MLISDDEILKIAKLSKLIINNEKIANLSLEINNILTLTNQMAELDTSEVKPLSHPYEETQPLREDKITEINQQTLFQSIAPQTEAGLYIVPAVIEPSTK